MQFMNFLKSLVMRYDLISELHDKFHGFTEFKLSQKVILDCQSAFVIVKHNFLVFSLKVIHS